MGTNSNSPLKNFFIYTALSSSVLSMSYDTNDLIPHIETDLNLSSQISEWKDLAFNNSPFYELRNEDSEKIQTILSFSEKIINNTYDIDDEFVSIVNENFWELI